MTRTVLLVMAPAVSAILCSCGGGPAGGPGDSTATVAVQTTRAVCTTSQTLNGFDLGNVVASGTASGPQGSVFTFDISNGGQSAVTIDCGGWTQGGTLANNVTCTGTAGTPSIAWTVTQEVYWCTSGCDSSPAQNNADLTVKYTTAAIVDASNANQHTSALSVSCGP